jgi:hypothetical protein
MPAFTPRRRPLAIAVAALALTLLVSDARAADWDRPTAAADPGGRPVTVRVTWGGGKARAWSGTIRVVTGGAGASADEPAWRTLCADADAAATAHGVPGGIDVHEPRGRGFDGVEITINGWRDARLVVRLMPDGDERAAVGLEVPVVELVQTARQQALDRDGNRLMVRAAPGDGLRVDVLAASRSGAGPGPRTTLFRPGETVRLAVDPLLPRRSPGTAAVELRLRLKPGPETEPLSTQAVVLTESAAADDRLRAQDRIQEYDRVLFDVPLPDREGAYDIELEAVERGGLRWSRPLATRVVQVAAVADAPSPAAAADAVWQPIHELDPGSPRLHERLRRLPGKGIPYVPMPAMPLPSMSLPNVALPSVPMPSVPMPSVPLPSVAIPKVPGVPLPAVGMPSVSSMVPRLSGLLLTGHSTVDVHPSGPMLRLPPARSTQEPTWEGIVVAGVQPGMPHLVEIEYPLDQRAVVGVAVLEPDAPGTAVEVRTSGGFEVTPQPAASVDGGMQARLGRHAFVFWPTSRTPLILIANPSVRSAALFGRVRISAGPTRLPPADRQGGSEGGRRVLGFMPTPEFGMFGAAERPVAGQGKSFADWRTFLTGATRAAEWYAAQGAAGAMVVAYGDGAAIWPSRFTREAPRWDSGASVDAGVDPLRKDLLSLLCRVHARESLRLVPAVSFDAPLPALESILHRGGPAAAGIACVGRDGRPRRTAGAGGTHYNILDARVQRAVEEIVAELAGRLRDAEAVDGVALLMPHHGWTHLPGTAWGLDDATFARFLADVGGQEPAAGPERFARRAALVEGPLRESWLEWRTAAVARFHARLAAILAEHDPRWSLHVVPTSLFSQGELAERFRPTLAGQPGDADVLREIGVDPVRITADRRIVFVTPHVHSAADLLLDRSLVEGGNRSLAVARAVAGAARRGVIALELPTPIAVDQVVPHGPFGNAASAAPVMVHAVPAGAARGRALAESFVASDVEVVFDMGLSFARVDEAHAARMTAFAALPVGGFELADTLAAPLVIRSRRDAGATIASVANAGPASCRAVLSLSGAASAVVDAADRSRLPLDPGGGTAVPLGPWEVRTLVLDGGVAVQGARAEFDDDVRRSIEARLADLRRRRAALETPRPLEALDNPGFELDGAGAVEAGGGAVAGWELVEPSRGGLAFVPGADGPSGRGVAFSSLNGLSTLRSNPFSPPVSGRISVAAWLRIAEGEPQPPLRIAIEGVQDDREYYRFAPVGGLTGGKPLTAEWSQFVLQIDDVPVRGLESLRVRLDLLGPGSVQLDGVRVFDLAFDEQQRVDLSRRLAVVEQRLAANDLGGCLMELDGHWPQFLAEFVSNDAVAAVEREPAPAREPPAGAGEPPARSGSVFDRMRRWLQ